MFNEHLLSCQLATTISTMTRPREELTLYPTTSTESLPFEGANGRVKTITPMEWWVNNCNKHPTLSRMALDYLSDHESVPGTSTLVFITSSNKLITYLATSVELTPREG